MQPLTAPLSDEEYDTLADYLDDFGALGMSESIGLLNAVAVAPGLIQPSTWLRVVVPEGAPAAPNLEKGQEFFGLIMRQYNEVLRALAEGQIVAPEPTDVEDCLLFASGYATGAALDPEWTRDADAWSLAAPFAYLAERFDLVPSELKAELDADPAARAKICIDLVPLVSEAYEVFRAEAAAHQAQQPVVREGPRVGRNDPCPCGSGRKFKRCCGAN